MQEPAPNLWQTQSSRIVYQNPWFRVRTDNVITPAGQPGTFNVVEQPPSVYVVAIDQSQCFVLVGLYRYPTAMYSLEIPAGGSDGQAPLTAAQRELQEETGFSAAQWQHLGKLQSANGYSSGMAEVFLARGLTQTGHHEQAAEGITRVQHLPLKDVRRCIMDGTISDSQSVAAIYLATVWLDNQA